MGDLVNINAGTPELGYWTCGCGCTTHRVRSDGEIECATCGDLARGLGYWRKPEESEIRETKVDEPVSFTETTPGQEFAQERFARRVRAGEFSVLIGIRDEDGGMTCQHGDCETAQQRAWLRRRLREAYRVITREAWSRIEKEKPTGRA